MHFKIIKTIAASGFLTALECTKFVFGRGSAPEFAGGGSYSAPPNPVVKAGFKPDRALFGKNVGAPPSHKFLTLMYKNIRYIRVNCTQYCCYYLN